MRDSVHKNLYQTSVLIVTLWDIADTITVGQEVIYQLKLNPKTQKLLVKYKEIGHCRLVKPLAS
jgi:hypothetical protein